MGKRCWVGRAIYRRRRWFPMACGHTRRGEFVNLIVWRLVSRWKQCPEGRFATIPNPRVEVPAGISREECSMPATFTSGRFRFAVEQSDADGDLARGFGVALQDDEVDLRLTDTGKVPELDGAPIASWLLARLARLTENQLGVGGTLADDGSDFVIDFVAYAIPADPTSSKAKPSQPLLFDLDELDVRVEPDRPVASFQFQAGMEGAAVVGQRARVCSAEELLKAFAAALLAAPTELTAREIAVRDPEWKLDPEIYRP